VPISPFPEVVNSGQGRGHVDVKTLCFLHSLTATYGVTRDIVHRQYVVKKNSSKSWIIHAKKTLQNYSLPTIHDLLMDPH
jgi:hypothetical protein